jgi:hypothetical protein
MLGEQGLSHLPKPRVEMSEIGPGPSVVVSRDGNHAVLIEFEQTAAVPNRDAVGFDFSVQHNGSQVPFTVSVIFSGSTFRHGNPFSVFGVNEGADRLDMFCYLAEVRIGDYLDEVGEPVPPTGGAYAVELECYSDRFETWENRPAESDAEVEEYVANRLYWAWKFDRSRVAFRAPDLIRLRVSPATLHRVIELGDASLWKVLIRTESIRVVTASKDLLRTRDARMREPAIRGDAKQARRSFVDKARLQELQHLHSDQHDLTKLIGLCEELNRCVETECVFAIAMLTRAILDHVPPIFGAARFSEVANNAEGAKSFKESMQHLSNSARKIADAHLHVQIRRREVLPTMVQVDFSRDLDVLLGEIVRVLK